MSPKSGDMHLKMLFSGSESAFLIKDACIWVAPSGTGELFLFIKKCNVYDEN